MPGVNLEFRSYSSVRPYINRFARPGDQIRAESYTGLTALTALDVRITLAIEARVPDGKMELIGCAVTPICGARSIHQRGPLGLRFVSPADELK